MYGMHLDIVFAQDSIRMARLASRRLQASVAMVGRRHGHFFRRDMTLGAIGRLAVQLVVRMTIGTIHPAFTEMDITRDAFMLAEILIPYPAAVTGCAGTGHRRSAHKFMAFE
jgi:hypothetical protein